MSAVSRLASRCVCRLLLGLLPDHRKMWGQAVRAEAEAIADDVAAFLFALDALRGFALLSLSDGFSAAAAALGRSLSFASSRVADMTNQDFDGTKPGLVGIASAIGAVGLGLAYLFPAGAPLHMIGMNAGALILGIAAMMIWTRIPAAVPQGSGIALVVMALALLATAMGGRAADGVSRWAMIGPLAVQPSLIVLPAMILLFVRDRGPIATAGMLIAALAMAMQPDRAMAGVTMGGLAALAIGRRDRPVMIALVASVVAFGVTMVRPDPSPPVPYVDQILYTAFDVHLLAGLAVAAGSALLLLPALHGLRFGSNDRSASLVFGTVWLLVIVAAAIGNYPTPLVGYGGSAILGYLLSVGALARSAKARIVAGRSGEKRTGFPAGDPRSRFAMRHLVRLPSAS